MGFEVLTALVVKSSVFWDLTMSDPLNVKISFAGTWRFLRQCKRVG
jgi:hypothetical protein